MGFSVDSEVKEALAALATLEGGAGFERVNFPGGVSYVLRVERPRKTSVGFEFDGLELQSQDLLLRYLPHWLGEVTEVTLRSQKYQVIASSHQSTGFLRAIVRPAAESPYIPSSLGV